MLKNIKMPARCEHVTLEKTFKAIRSTWLKQSTIALREAAFRGEKKVATQLKEKLPAILFGGRFTHASDAGLEAHSGYLVVDFDKLEPDQIGSW